MMPPVKLFGPALEHDPANPATPPAARLSGEERVVTHSFDDSPPTPDLLAGSNAWLVALIRDEIVADGAIHFARFMELALYAPGLGYYQTPERRPGRGGDFLTAPEATPLFGITIARQIADCWELLGRPERFIIREYGAGIGGLAYDILAGLSEASPGAFAAAEYRLVEISEERIAPALAAMHEAGLSEKVEAELAGDALEAIEGVAIANEVADALPVHRLIWRNGELHELWVGWRDGWFADVEGPLSAEAVDAAAHVRTVIASPEDGDRFDVSPAAMDWMRLVGAGLRRGFAFVIDYGYRARELYEPARRDGLVRGYAEHTVTDNPYLRVGTQDLTAHVDFDALTRSGEEAGMELAGLTTQGEFLSALGMGELLVAIQQDPEMTLEQYLAAQAAVLRLIDPGGLGRFRVLAMTKGIELGQPLRGFRQLSGLF
jgi:SAM-dependent MidA family methyltransferase